jgi:hypothetical protein
MSALKFAAVGASVAAVYVEDVFSTYLYTGNGSTQTITNGIDLAGKGGLVWIKNRTAAFGNRIYSEGLTANGYFLYTNSTNGQSNSGNPLTYASNGWSIVSANNDSNDSVYNYASWTFRKQPKFFDVVTYTGDGANRTIAHSLGAVPGSIIVKRTDIAANWAVYHRSLANTQYLVLNTTAAAVTGATWWNSTTPTSAVFSVGTNASVNASGGTYVAYLFAHDAGGFGLTGTDNVISCGSSVGGGLAGDVTVNLGYEPQWVLLKRTDSATIGEWELIDNMRGWPDSSAGENYLLANTSAAEATGGYWTGHPTATGFTHYAYAGATYIYIAIRRGPMKVPTTGTSVFLPNNGASSLSGQTISTIFPVDLIMSAYQTQGYVGLSNDRLRGISNINTAGTTPAIQTSTTDAESAFSATNPWFIKAVNNSITRGSNGADPSGGIVSWLFGRAPGFFDVVCYTGTGVANTQAHNLTVAPELILIKRRDSINNWITLYDFSSSTFMYFLPGVNGTSASFSIAYGSGAFLGSQPTLTQLPLNSSASQTNSNTGTYVAYLFATLAGISKVGSYTGNGTTQTIACGFATGARFILIKRTDAVGDWYVWDSARGIVAGNDPHLSLNTIAAEVTTDDSVDTASSGFIVNQLAATNINVSAATYIFLSCS